MDNSDKIEREFFGVSFKIVNIYEANFWADRCEICGCKFGKNPDIREPLLQVDYFISERGSSSEKRGYFCHECTVAMLTDVQVSVDTIKKRFEELAEKFRKEIFNKVKCQRFAGYEIRCPYCKQHFKVAEINKKIECEKCGRKLPAIEKDDKKKVGSGVRSVKLDEDE